MPIPVVIGLYELIVMLLTWAASRWGVAVSVAAGTATLSGVDLDTLMDGVRKFVAGQLNQFLPGANFVAADITIAGFERGLARELFSLMGIEFRDLTNKTKIREDVIAFAGAQLAAKLGVSFSDITDTNAIKADLLAYGGAQFEAKTGIYTGPLTDVEAVKANVLAWAQGQTTAAMTADAATAKAALLGVGVDSVAVAAQVKKTWGITMSDGKAALAVVDKMLATHALRRFDELEKLSKKDRRRIMNRGYQEKFRKRANAKPGDALYDGRVNGKSIYVPKGYTITVSPPAGP